MTDTKKILVIGNGFDLHHGLPTGYMDYVEYLDENPPAFWGAQNYWYNAIKYDLGKSPKENWIDFEEIIKENLKHINILFGSFDRMLDKHDQKDGSKHMPRTTYLILTNNFPKIFDYDDKNEYLIKTDNEKGYIIGLRKEKIIKKLKDDLNKLVNDFNNYLIEKASKSENSESFPEELKEVDYLISYNYTQTYHNCEYKAGKEFYIHGKVKEYEIGYEKKHNIVLGVYDKKNLNDFIVFNKVYQRMALDTDYAVFKELENDKSKYQINFFGHSLDKSDKDSLKKLFTPDMKGRSEYVFYHRDNNSKIRQIANLIKILDISTVEDLMSTKTIKFKQI